MRPDTIRPALGITPEARAHYLAMAHQSIEDHARAVRAVHLLEVVARGPKVRSPRHLARELRTLADELEAAA